MTANRRRLRHLLGPLALAVGLAGSSGCLCLYHNPPVLPQDCTTACSDVPCACRGKVYVFLLSGFDPLDLDHVGEFRMALLHAGFTKVYSGQFYHDTYFAAEMHRLALTEPDAKFVVVGFSTGAIEAVSLAESVAAKSIGITLLASVDPPWWSGAPAELPPNVQQVMHVHGQPVFVAPPATPGIDVEIPESFPTNITAHSMTVETLARTLAGIAGAVPRPTPPQTAAPALVENGPTPRPVARRSDGPRDDWDFLKPVATLRSATQPEAPPTQPTAPVGSERVAAR